jgi:hypothetical protein
MLHDKELALTTAVAAGFTVEVDNYGQIILYTGLRFSDTGTVEEFEPEDEEPTYKIVRCFQDYKVPQITLVTGLTLQEAQEWYNDPETSSKTCTTPSKVALTEQVGPWFDAYCEE